MKLSWIFAFLLVVIACQLLTSADAKVKSKSKTKAKKPASSSVGAKNKPASSNNKPASSNNKPKPKPNEKKPVSSSSKKEAAKKKAIERQSKAKKMFKALKRKSQLDLMMGDNTLRADKHGGKLDIQRKGQYFGMRIKHIVEKHSNGTEVCMLIYIYNQIQYMQNIF